LQTIPQEWEKEKCTPEEKSKRYNLNNSQGENMMKNVKKAAPQYDAPSPWLLQFAKQSVGLRLSTAEDLMPPSKEEHRKQLREDREYKRKVRHGWKSASHYKCLALQLGVGGVFAAPSGSGRAGEYLNGTLPGDWILSERRRAFMNGITEDKDLPVILIDIHQAAGNDGVSQTISHEIGHHIDWLAKEYPRKPRKPTQALISAFNRASFHEYTGEWSDLYSELIAETLGQYLMGHDLNRVLLIKVGKVFGNLTRKHQRIIRRFRNNQRKLRQLAEPKIAA
jgi:hypothetical protein